MFVAPSGSKFTIFRYSPPPPPPPPRVLATPVAPPPPPPIASIVLAAVLKSAGTGQLEPTVRKMTVSAMRHLQGHALERLTAHHHVRLGRPDPAAGRRADRTVDVLGAPEPELPAASARDAMVDA